jgi:hypothetical protein
LPVRAVRSFSMPVVSSGVSQKPFWDMMPSISLSLILLASMSKIPFQIFKFLFEIFEGLLEFERHGVFLLFINHKGTKNTKIVICEACFRDWF